MSVTTPGDLASRRARGAFFTPQPVAAHLASWAVRSDPQARVLDPTCGEAVFLAAAGRELTRAGCQPSVLNQRLFGIDLDAESVSTATRILASEGVEAQLRVEDFFAIPTPDQLGSPLPYVDAVVGNPPFVRYQQHAGTMRRRSLAAALAQGVRLNGLASSWAALLVHACGFLKPEGRLAMVLPAELLTVSYAEPVRAWLRRRFERVHLVLFDQLIFDGALEKVMLVLAEGSGGCEAFSLYHVPDAASLSSIGPYMNWSVTPSAEGKWTDLLLPHHGRQLFKQVVAEHFVPLSDYGSTELGIVTGANSFFTLPESTRMRFGLQEDQLVRISPPGTRHLRGTTFSSQQWLSLHREDERVWLLRPEPDDDHPGLRAYIAAGEAAGVHSAYKCQIRTPWWRPPIVPAPDLFFTYMSHRYPRLISNSAKVTFVNSMHGVRVRTDIRDLATAALPLLSLNSVTMLGAEVFGRSYGGGVLKMEPREAAVLPMPSLPILQRAWRELEPHKDVMELQLREGMWASVVKRVDAAVLESAARLSARDAVEVMESARCLRLRRLGREVAREDERDC
jgi:adenine-specific DNA-methyltransferase